MTNGNFRRQLGRAFDEVAGSPSGALPDRGRSSLANVPEQRGPYWIAGLAAALIALVVIGVLFVGNPLKHQPSKVVPGPGTSPTPSASQSASPSASPTPSSQPFVCAWSTTFTEQQPPQSAYVDAVRTGAHTGYDRLTIEFQNGQPQTIPLQPQATTGLTRARIGHKLSL